MQVPAAKIPFKLSIQSVQRRHVQVIADDIQRVVWAHRELQSPEPIQVVQTHWQDTHFIFVICVDWTNKSSKLITDAGAFRPAKHKYALPAFTNSNFANLTQTRLRATSAEII